MNQITAQIAALNAVLLFADLVVPNNATSSQEDVISTLRLLRPHSAEGVTKRRFGSAGDGGYVMIDDLHAIETALSFGIDVNDDWDMELACLGIKVKQFDNSVDRAPSTHQNLSFERKTVGTRLSPDVVTLPGLLETIDGDIILKIDIEGHEWDVFDSVETRHLRRCRQICCEFHDLAHLGNGRQLQRYRRVLEKLAETHRVVHVHANNCASIKNIQNVAVPDVLEVTFASIDAYALAEAWEIFPGPLDAPNRTSAPDIRLGCFVF